MHIILSDRYNNKEQKEVLKKILKMKSKSVSKLFKFKHIPKHNTSRVRFFSVKIEKKIPNASKKEIKNGNLVILFN